VILGERCECACRFRQNWFTDGDHKWGLPSGQTQDYFKHLVSIYAARKISCIYCYTVYTLILEWDERKNHANIAKHGISRSGWPPACSMIPFA